MSKIYLFKVIPNSPIFLNAVFWLFQQALRNGWSIRVPEFSSLLAAKLSMNSEVTVIASETDVGLEDTALIIDDKLIAKGTREFIGSLASLALKTAANPETWKIIHGLRLKVLFAELNRNSE